MKVLYFDCFAGISGDMTLGALLDLGIDKEFFLTELKKIDITGYEIEIRRGMKKGISGTDVVVKLHGSHDQDHSHNYGPNHERSHVRENDNHRHGEHRDFGQIKALIEGSGISENAKKLAILMFENLARAEGKIHGVPAEKVHFHEVGAIDSIIDIVGTAICIDVLAPDKIVSSPVHIGRGMIRCEHGVFPVPAPATMELLKNIPIYSRGIEGELVTPTGATILASLCSEFGTFPSMSVEKIGYGLGKRDFDFPNCLRVCLGEVAKK